ncbi:MAG TPA: ATP-binding protein [Desulfitobacteriaceae bacterium]|nr:ATP-binding protein [Desulfitobacteriaceae bacterium]
MKTLIQVCGDPTVDWFRIHNEDSIVREGVYYWKKQEEDSWIRLSSNPGGSAFVLQLLNSMIPQETAMIEGAILAEELLNSPKDNRITTSWKSWKESPNPGFNHNSYRIEEWHEFEPGNWDYSAARLKGCPDLLVIQDIGLGFRDCKEGWPEVLADDSREKLPSDIIFKLGQYNESKENPLLDRIAELGLADRTTIVTTLSDLRSCAVKIGISLSWERMLEEVVDAVFNPNCPFVDPGGKGLKYKQVIVTMGASGVIIVEERTDTIIFDRSGQEGDFASRFPGQMMGYNTCLLGALAATWAESPEKINWIEASCIGVKLARTLHIQGYQVVKKDHLQHLQFPFQAIADAYLKLKYTEINTMNNPCDQINDMGIFTIENDALAIKTGRDNWTILEENLLQNKKYQDSLLDPQSTVFECARNIVVKGPLVSLPNVPVEIFGAWSSADRQEIEGVHSVNNAMNDYLKHKGSEKPLCIAVFGPPGAGKSFVVKEIAKGLGIRSEAQLTYNLSQFESPDELQIAFSEIRDLNLKGIMPLVFWDEFDTPCEGKTLGWLRYFLAPMQDGEFTDHGVSRPLGGGIYVFAGATRHTFEEFKTGDNTEDRAAKKPDFTSRLRAYINIRGINGNPNTVEDRLYMIRRAFVLRQYLEIISPQLWTNGEFAIEAGVLDAFLRVTQYSHGARSLENLIKMSNLTDKRKFELSSLPPDNIIEMHVNVEEFKALTAKDHREMLRIGISGHDNLVPDEIERLEEAVDDVINFIEKQFSQHFLTVFSPLAEGADRLVVRRLLNRDATRLIAVLPLAQDEYINEFGLTDDYRVDSHGAELRQELRYWLAHKAIETIEMSPSATRKAAYLKVGHFIAENSDILIVLWDGNEDQNSSLTSQIVARAEKLNKPICHIWANNYKRDPLSFNMEIACGEIQYKNFLCQTQGNKR